MRDWTTTTTAQNWSDDAWEFNPWRGVYLELTARLISRFCPSGGRVLDVGIGTGDVETLLLAMRSDICVTGIDESEAMMTVAQQRLRSYGERLQLNAGHATDLSPFHAQFDMVIASQVLHHIPLSQQAAVCQQLYNVLSPDGLTLVTERVRVPSRSMSEIYGALWDWQWDNQARRPSRGHSEYLERLRHPPDGVISGSQHMEHLRRAGFDATCVHRVADRALFIGVKGAPLRLMEPMGDTTHAIH